MAHNGSPEQFGIVSLRGRGVYIPPETVTLLTASETNVTESKEYTGAWSQLYLCSCPELNSYCNSFLSNYQSAEDVVQDSFIKCFNKATTFDEARATHSNPFWTWMLKITHNVTIDYIRKRKKEFTTETLDTVTDKMSAGNWQHQIEFWDVFEEIKKRCSVNEQKELVALLLGYSPLEARQFSDVGVAAIYYRRQKALETARSILEDNALAPITQSAA